MSFAEKVNICTLMTVALLALLLSFSSGPLAHAQTQPNGTSTNSTTPSASIFYSSSISNTNTTSATYVSTWTSLSSTIDSASSTSSSAIVTSTVSASSSSSQTTSTISLESVAPLTVPSITLNPSSGSAGSTIDVSGSGFSTSDTACSISGKLVAAGSCSVSGGVLAATAFTVDDVTDGSYRVMVRGTPSKDSASAQFTVNGSTTSTTSATTNMASYSLSFSPTYWFCTDVSVTFTGPLVESGFYGDTLQFQYFQYNPTYPSVLNPIFTDPSLTVTSDTVNYWISYNEYAPVNFAYLPNIAVKVVDVTPKSNGYAPGLIFMQLTNITPQSGQYCPLDSPAPVPEFQSVWLMIIASVVLGSVFLGVHKYRPSKRFATCAFRSKREIFDVQDC